jgi:hypothetical protein
MMRDLLPCAALADIENGATTRDPTKIVAATVELRKGRLADCIFWSLLGPPTYPAAEAPRDQEFKKI